MTGAETLAYIKRTFKRSDKDTELYEAISDTLLDIKIRYPFDQFKVEDYTGSISTAGDFRVDIPDDMGHIIGNVILIDGTSSTTLRKVTKQDFDRLYPDANETGVSTGVPRHWCLFGQQIFVGPVPDKTTYNYQISHTNEEALTIDASTSDVPFSTKSRDLLKAGTLYRIYRDLEDDGNATKWLPIYENEIAKLIDSERNNDAAVGHVKYNDI